MYDDVMGPLSGLLILSAAALLVVQGLSFFGGALLLHHRPDHAREGWALLRIFVVVNGAFVLVQALSLWRAVMLVSNPDDTQPRLVNFLITQILATSTLVWALWRVGQLMPREKSAQPQTPTLEPTPASPERDAPSRTMIRPTAPYPAGVNTNDATTKTSMLDMPIHTEPRHTQAPIEPASRGSKTNRHRH